MKNFLLSLSIALTLVGCANEELSKSHKKDIHYTSLDIDTISVGVEQTSFDVCSGVFDKNANVFFFDKYFGYLYEINLDGKLVNRSMGVGRGPDEVPMKMSSSGVMYGDNNMIIIGSSYDLYRFERGKGKAAEKINIIVSSDGNSLNSSRAYTSYSEIMKVCNNKLYYNVYSESRANNPALHSKTYFKNAHILMSVDLEDGKAEPIGCYPQSYIENYDLYKHLFKISYDIDSENNFYICHPADSLIYKYNREFEAVETIGFAGTEMNTNYTKASDSWASLNTSYKEDSANKGYYYWIEYFEDKDMLFRSYQKGSHTPYDGLQIYKGTTLIADVEVPKTFKVIGYSHPYFVTSIEGDLETETLHFYRFKLDEK